MVSEPTEVCLWLVGERAPIAASDERWDRLVYSLRDVENLLPVKARPWW